MGCNASKDVIKSSKVSPATYEEYEKAHSKELATADSQQRIVTPLNDTETLDSSIQEELDAIKRSTERIHKKNPLPSIPKQKAVAFEILLGDSNDGVPAIISNPTPTVSRLALPKLETANSGLTTQSSREEIVVSSNTGNGHIRRKTKMQLTQTQKEVDPEILKQRIREKEEQAALNRMKEIERLQNKLARQEEHLKNVQARKKKITWEDQAVLQKQGSSDSDSGLGRSASNSRTGSGRDVTENVAAEIY